MMLEMLWEGRMGKSYAELKLVEQALVDLDIIDRELNAVQPVRGMNPLRQPQRLLRENLADPARLAALREEGAGNIDAVKGRKDALMELATTHGLDYITPLAFLSDPEQSRPALGLAAKYRTAGDEPPSR